MLSFAKLSWALLLLQPCIADNAINRLQNVRLQQEVQRQAVQPVDNAGIASCNSTSCYRYYNSKTKPYFIESFPDVSFATGEFYGGSIPIDESKPNRTLFFIFKPAQGPPVKEITIWLNGGPGCSSLVGFFQENGPILWQPGTAEPVENTKAWSKLTNMLWVEQPVGTGYTTGKVTATNEIDVAKDFVGFFENWQKLFGIKNHKIFVTGESYAGRYIPYIGAEMLDQNDTTYFDLKGALMYDPCIGDCNYVQAIAPTYDFVVSNNEILNFNATELAQMKEISAKCGFTAYMDKYLTFPPPGIQPPEPSSKNYTGSCDIFKPFNAITRINPCFNIYHISDYCPLLNNVMVDGNPYFNRADVKKALHAPADVEWVQCSNRNVFLKGDDTSVDSSAKVLPQVIEATNRVLVSNANWDGLIYTKGTLMVVQNTTWNGKLGFQTKPSAEFVVPGQGVMGIHHYERGLQWVETYQAGHMQPQYQPAAALLHLQWLLGRISTF